MTASSLSAVAIASPVNSSSAFSVKDVAARPAFQWMACSRLVVAPERDTVFVTEPLVIVIVASWLPTALSRSYDTVTVCVPYCTLPPKEAGLTVKKAVLSLVTERASTLHHSTSKVKSALPELIAPSPKSREVITTSLTVGLFT